MNKENCEICNPIPDSDYGYLDREDRHKLPSSAAKLQSVGEDFKQCPICGAYYHYHYMPPGPGNIGDREDLDRFNQDENHLLDAIQSANFGLLAKLLKKAVSQENEEMKCRAESIFSYFSKNLDSGALLSFLKKFLRDKNFFVRNFACRFIADLAKEKTDVSSVIPDIKKLLSDKEDAVKLNAASILDYFGQYKKAIRNRNKGV
jgi:hypothetical protein